MRSFCLILLLAAIPLVSSAQAQTAESQTAVSPNQCRNLLQTSLVDFYLPASLDKKFGGYHEELDRAGDFVGGDKFLTMQARQLWFFSTLAINDIRRQESLSAADFGYKFLREHFYDPDHGGYITKTKQGGESLDERKHVYPNAFVIYALVEYARATGKDAPLDQAKELFETLEEHCYDKDFGGYQEFFYKDWSIVTDPKESGYVGAINTKTYNSHLHLLEAFTELYKETHDELVGRRLGELITINTLTVKHPKFACNIDGWNRQWQMIQSPANLRASYGHDVECAWLVLEAAKALGQSTSILESWAISTCQHSLQYGYDEKHGGFHYTGTLGQPSDETKKVWWTQTEAMVAMLTLYQITGEEQYKRRFEETYRFCEKYHVADEGGWWNTLTVDGKPDRYPSRTSMWQGAYHNARALIRCEQLLKQTSTN
ncbi:AGE family epimerase/isomerase [Stieleria sp. JC731]|uniref:AGE family epimerase/isomerase n=1 Tax=Pirellulaceae TaxID=2691357 RepID=UPI001E293DFA|nr:AGE family epimerase/isomerase [Stieleria sp. JC731]MCC9600707.1 AGE family epimerase/isomerase [Stieleria sp. JC731]